jgi:hypothetical protein
MHPTMMRGQIPHHRVARWDTQEETQGRGTYLVLDEGSQGEKIEEVGEKSPDVGISVLAQTLVVEAVNLCDLPALVVSPEDGDAVAVAQLHCNKECDGLDRVVSSVDIIAHEKIVGVRGVSTDTKELREIVLYIGWRTKIRKRRQGYDIRM